MSERSTTTEWPALPTETEIYILADGQVVIADLPVELASALDSLGHIEQGSCPIESSDLEREEAPEHKSQNAQCTEPEAWYTHRHDSHHHARAAHK